MNGPRNIIVPIIVIISCVRGYTRIPKMMIATQVIFTLPVRCAYSKTNAFNPHYEKKNCSSEDLLPAVKQKHS